MKFISCSTSHSEFLFDFVSSILIWRNKCIILKETNTIPSLEGINDSMLYGIKIKNLMPD